MHQVDNYLQEQRGESGELDWIMLYTPGRRAQAEFREASKKPRRIQRPNAVHLSLPQITTALKQPERQARQSDSSTSSERPAAAIHDADPESEHLVSRLVKFHISETTARELVRDYRKSVELQLRALPHRNINKIKDFASWLIAAIKENYQLPEQIIAAIAREEEVKHAIAKREAELECQQRREALQPAYYDYLRGRAGEIEKEQEEAYRAFLAKEAGERSEIENNRLYKPKFRGHLLANFDDEESHLDRLRDYFHEPTLDKWLEANPEL